MTALCLLLGSSKGSGDLSQRLHQAYQHFTWSSACETCHMAHRIQHEFLHSCTGSVLLVQVKLNLLS
jgi:DnaJ-class molecular chaperone